MVGIKQKRLTKKLKLNKERTFIYFKTVQSKTLKMYLSLNYIAIVLLILKINRIHAVGQIYTSDANNKYYMDFDASVSL